MITHQQKSRLFEFCQKHFVHHYDVQLELEDHLANAIDEQMKNDPSLSFEKALENVYESFGAAGFAPLVSEKRKSVERQGRQLFWKLFKEHFRWPKILLFLIIISLGFTMFSIDSDLYRIFYISVSVACLLAELYGIVKTRKEISSTGKKFLIAEFSQNVPLILLFFYCFIFPDAFETDFPPTSHAYFSILFLNILIGIVVLITIVNWQVLSSLTSDLRNDYPEVFAAIN